MIEAGTIAGTIESNNGAEALVSFADGAQQRFVRFGGTVEAGRLGYDISTREGLFATLENLFSNEGIEYTVVGISKRGKPVLVGKALNISGLAVFCAPFFEPPDGSDGRYFALGRGDQWEWLEVSQENLEYVCGEVANASNRLRDID